MNCLPDDLAVVVTVGPYAELRHMIGQIRQVKKLEMAWDGPAWTYEGRRFKQNGLICCAIPDAWLRPIRAPGLTQQEVDTLYLPVPMKAPERAYLRLPVREMGRAAHTPL